MRVLRVINALVLIGVVGGAGFVMGALERIGESLPPAEQLAAYRPSVTTEIYSSQRHTDGTVEHTLLARLFDQDRTPMALKD
ncbi:MAG TPA: hypothetical protein QGH10_08545, partial [Armatimonadota bacterium]|nr:hypothetical protein [Armatimonadota bacterium]